ncbi:hypothetical protein [Porphyromonas circumdentaria]|nr:hypothetical protein [Porphyromonas circumdentaria]MDO4722462.1 hypothetical protein [Porphyromonas circumdentaria]
MKPRYDVGDMWVLESTNRTIIELKLGDAIGGAAGEWRTNRIIIVL